MALLCDNTTVEVCPPLETSIFPERLNPVVFGRTVSVTCVPEGVQGKKIT